jgi:hypothetical protein
MRFFSFGFFMNHLPPGFVYPISVIPIFLNICKDICSSKCIIGIKNIDAKLTTGGHIFPNIHIDRYDTNANLPLVTTMRAAYCHQCQQLRQQQVSTTSLL